MLCMHTLTRLPAWSDTACRLLKDCHSNPQSEVVKLGDLGLSTRDANAVTKGIYYTLYYTMRYTSLC